MTRTIITPSDLSQRTREILDWVQQGELTVVASRGAERIVLLGAMRGFGTASGCAGAGATETTLSAR